MQVANRLKEMSGDPRQIKLKKDEDQTMRRREHRQVVVLPPEQCNASDGDNLRFRA